MKGSEIIRFKSISFKNGDQLPPLEQDYQQIINDDPTKHDFT